MADSPLFSAFLTPYRSMGRNGIRWVTAFTLVMASIPGIFFYAVGAWPIVGLLGLDVLVLWWALRSSLRSGEAFEEVTLWRDQLEIRHVTANGQEQTHQFNPYWVRFDVERDYDDRVVRLTLTFRQAVLEFGTFLTPDDKAEFAKVFNRALSQARG